jgi:predicted RNase H-like nuclease (RuvC/YqgF family)
MTDPNEPIEERLKRLEAEAAELRKKLAEVTDEREEFRGRYRSLLHEHNRRVWEGFTQEELDETIRNGVTLKSLIEQMERGGRHG